MRLFFGFELPDPIKELAESAILYLKSYIPTSVKWVETESLHITFQFVGEVKPTDLADIEEAFVTCIGDCQKQTFTLLNVSCYPLREPKVIWISLAHNDKALNKSVKCFQTKLQQLGYKTDNKDFTAHITLGRIKANLMIPQIDFMLKTEIEQQEFTIDELTLFESNLTKKGAVYRTLQTYNLKE